MLTGGLNAYDNSRRGTRSFHDLGAAVSATDIRDYSKVPETMYEDWLALLKMNSDPRSPNFRMLGAEREKEIRRHVEKYAETRRTLRLKEAQRLNALKGL